MKNKFNIYHFFWKIAGEDCQLLNKSESHLRIRYLLSGLIICVLFVTSLISFYHSLSLIFKINIIAMTTSLFISLMLFNIYRLNLITLKPNKLKYDYGNLLSLLVRIVFLILIGLAISKPLETLLFKKIGLEQGQSFISSIRILNRDYPVVWIFTFLFIALFITPLFIKITVDPSNTYSRSILILNKKIIEEDYDYFKTNYSLIFKKSIGVKIEITEKYEDPPFNTIRKKNTLKVGTEKDFINHLYGH